MSNNPKNSNSGYPEPLWIGDMFQNHTAFLKKLFWIYKQNMPMCCPCPLLYHLSLLFSVLSPLPGTWAIGSHLSILLTTLNKSSFLKLFTGMCYSPLSNSLPLCQLLSASLPNPFPWKWRPKGRHYCIWVSPASAEGRAKEYEFSLP